MQIHFCSSKVGFNNAGYNNLSSFILWRILEAFSRSIIPMLKFLHGKNKQTNFVKTILHSIHLASGGPTNTHLHACFWCHASTLPLGLRMFSIFFFGRWGTTTTTTMTLLHLTSRPNMVYMSWGLLVTPQLLCEHEVKNK
jgi:hypothetical protein